jgi:hypothetical protein
MNYIFDQCVALLVWLASLTGTTYEQINVIVFCFLWPGITTWLIWTVCQQRARINSLKQNA